NEQLIRAAIEREFPQDGILGEEGASKIGTSGRLWIIDPIDGTRDFVRGNRFWCVLIALMHGDEPAVGVAHFPMLGGTYRATRGGGAYLGDERLLASNVDSIEACAFNPNGLQLSKARLHMDRVVAMIQRSWSTRSYGGALDGCLVAAGKVDVWFEPKVEVWDLAALKLIIEEAGGKVFAIDWARRHRAWTGAASGPRGQAQ